VSRVPIVSCSTRPPGSSTPTTPATAQRDEAVGELRGLGDAGRRVLERGPTGRSFKTMAIDLFTVRDGKLAQAFHIENWMTALEQLRA
jgi:hypothetical protein